jgi:hypothetical protein
MKGLALSVVSLAAAQA